jgi:hypothetical protein
MRDRLGKESDCLVAGRTVLLGCVTALALNAERLPVKTYTTADGLAHTSLTGKPKFGVRLGPRI